MFRRVLVTGLGLLMLLWGGQAWGQGSNLDDDIFVVSCENGTEIIGGLKFTFLNVNPAFRYRVSVIGIGAFDPVMAVVTAPGTGLCNDDFPLLEGSQVALPDLGLIEADPLDAQLEISTGAGGNIDVLVGGFAGSSGQFALVVENLQVNPASDMDGFLLEVPAVVADYPVGVFMIGRDGSPLDPYLYAFTGPGLSQQPLNLEAVSLYAECDDVGTGNCEAVPAFPGGGTMIRNGFRYEAGPRDAGIVLEPGETERFLFGFASYNSASRGDYAVVVLGNAPGDLRQVPDDGLPPLATGASRACENVLVGISASSEYSLDDYGAHHLIDENPQTGWSSTAADSRPILELRLNPNSRVDRLLFNGYSRSEGYESDSIQDFILATVGSDGEPTVILEGSLPLRDAEQEFRFPPVQASELRLILSSNHGGDYFEASDIRICAADG